MTAFPALVLFEPGKLAPSAKHEKIPGKKPSKKPWRFFGRLLALPPDLAVAVNIELAGC